MHKFSVVSVRFIFSCATFEVQSNEDSLVVVHVAPLHISGLLLIKFTRYTSVVHMLGL